jgi:hypothetical protein
MDGTFSVTIPNLAALQEKLASYPEISAPIIQNAIVASQAILAGNTNATTVPVRTAYLVQNWGWQVGQFFARWFPMATYAPYVEFGTGPHIIKAVNKRVLANTATGQIFGSVVHHPGTKANPFLERIIAASQGAIDDLFNQALQTITDAISAQAE